MAAQAVRQTLSGAITTSLDLLVFQIGLCAGVPVLVSALLSFCVAVITNFCITRYYVFGDVKRQRKSFRTQFFIYLPLCLVSLALTQVILIIFNLHLGWPPLLVKIMAVPVVLLWTVIAGRFIVFNH